MTDKDWKSTFRAKLVHRLTELKMTQLEFSRRMGLSAALINHYCVGRKYPEANKLIKMEKVLSLPSGWFMYWEDDLSSTSKKVIKQIKSSVQELPILKMASIPDFLAGKKIPDTGKYRMIIMEKKLSTKSFIAIVEGDAMISSTDPKLSLFPGDEIIADPTLELVPGCLVIIGIDEHNIKIRQYQKDGQDILFKAFDSKYPHIKQNDSIKILAIIFEKRISLYSKK